MEEETTTNAPVEAGGQSIQGVQVDDQGQAVSQPEETEQAEAVAEPVVSEQTTPEATSEPSEDDQLKEWAQKKGLTLDSDNATKAAKMAREAEKAMHQKAQKASELEKTIQSASDEHAEAVAEATGQDPELLKRLQRVEVRDSIREFWDAHPEAKALEKEMIAELANKPYLAGDLESLHALALVKNGGLDAVKSQGKTEALKALAQNQQAAVPTGNAVNSNTTAAQKITPQNVDQMVATMSPEEYRKRLPEINAAMAG